MANKPLKTSRPLLLNMANKPSLKSNKLLLLDQWIKYQLLWLTSHRNPVDHFCWIWPTNHLWNPTSHSYWISELSISYMANKPLKSNKPLLLDQWIKYRLYYKPTQLCERSRSHWKRFKASMHSYHNLTNY